MRQGLMRLVAAVAAGALLVSSSLCLSACGKYEAQGRERIEAVGETSVDEVQEAIVQSRWQKVVDTFNSYMDDGQISRDEANAAFEGVCFIGDSITEGLNSYEYLSSDKVVAKIGVSLQSAGEMVTQAAQLYPLYVVIAFGENDLIADGGDSSVYVEHLDEVVQQVRAEIPSAKIYVASIMGPTDAAIAKQPVMGNWADFNSAMESYCSAHGDVTYIDTASTAAEHADMHEPDGMHFTGAFYAYYLAKVGSVIFS